LVRLISIVDLLWCNKGRSITFSPGSLYCPLQFHDGIKLVDSFEKTLKIERLKRGRKREEVSE
jgi:hypothetical protein